MAGAGRVAIPVVLGILPAADFLHVGDRVDLLAAPDDGDAAGLDTRARSPATVVAEDLLVLSIPHDSTMSSSDQTSVVVAATRDEALRITGTNVHAFVAVVRNGPSIAP